MMKLLPFYLSLIFTISLFAAPLPPLNPLHPGSQIYLYDYNKVILEKDGRELVFYYPYQKEGKAKVPLIVFGHGQALSYTHYEKSFIHFAKKGFAVLHPQYDRGFFDTKWQRMANDYNQLVSEVVDRYQSVIDTNQIVYSGHSKGAYIALLAAGSRPSLTYKPKAIVLFAPAGYDEMLLQELDKDTPLSIIRAKDDKIIKRQLNLEIYEKAPSYYKQFIELDNYPTLVAGHFFPLTKGTLLGGIPGPHAYHYYGKWKWLIGAAQDSNLTNSYIYGTKTTQSGNKQIGHSLLKSW